MSSNLPPGVTSSMIPGSRPEDLEEEAFFEALYENVANDLVDFIHSDQPRAQGLVDVITRARDLGYEKGRADGLTDAYFEQQAREGE